MCDGSSPANEVSGRSTTFETVLDLCREQQRRIVLAVLADNNPPLTVRDLTQAIVRYDTNTLQTAVSEEERAQVKSRCITSTSQS